MELPTRLNQCRTIKFSRTRAWAYTRGLCWGNIIGLAFIWDWVRGIAHWVVGSSAS